MGGVHGWAFDTLSLGLALVGGLLLMGSWKASIAIPPLAPALVLTGLTILQVLPSIKGLALGGPLRSSELPLLTSLSPNDTVREIQVLACSLLTLVAFAQWGESPSRSTRAVAFIALSSCAGLAIAIMHAAFSPSFLWGIFEVIGGGLAGPLINPNHSATYFELAAFICLAALYGSESTWRYFWGSLSVICSLSAVATLSRGAVIALSVGWGTFLLLAPGWFSKLTKAANGRKRTHWALVTVIIAALGVSLGANRIIDEFDADAVTGGGKVAVWKDAAPLLLSHPWGIGRGAFRDVYRNHRTLGGDVDYLFVECLPLQLAVDLGWLGLSLVLISCAYSAVWVFRGRPFQPPEAALISGIGAAIAHNFVDFSFEVPGIRILMAAMFGLLVGSLSSRRSSPSRPLSSPRWKNSLLIGVSAMLALSMAEQQSQRREFFDRAVRNAQSQDASYRLASLAAERYPQDFFYPLQQASFLPPGSSRRLSHLGRSISLCPMCKAPLDAVARAMWSSGHRHQAIATWNRLLAFHPAAGPEVYSLIANEGLKPQELLSFRFQDRDTQERALLELARQVSFFDELEDGLLRATINGSPTEFGVELKIVWLRSQGRIAEARKTAGDAMKLFPHAPSVFAAAAAVEQDAQSWDEALFLTKKSFELSRGGPRHDIVRNWFRLADEHGSAQQLEEALKAYRTVTTPQDSGAADVEIVAARAYLRRHNFAAANHCFRRAAAYSSNPTSVLHELASAAEANGLPGIAMDCYRQILTHSPRDEGAIRELKRLQAVVAGATAQ